MTKTLKEIKNILVNTNEKEFEKLCYWSTEWELGAAPKSRVNYWLEKIGLTFEEWELWESTL